MTRAFEIISSKSRNPLLYCILVIFFLQGCYGTRYLKDEEKILFKQKIRGADNLSREQYKELYRQEANRRIPIIPWSFYVSFYQIGKNYYDEDKYQQRIDEISEKYEAKIEEHRINTRKVDKLTKKRNKKIQKQERNIEEGNFLMRLGEPLAVLDSSTLNTTLGQFETYMQSKGYFDGTARYQIKVRNKLATVTYTLTEGMPYAIDSVYEIVYDEDIKKLIHAFDMEEEQKSKFIRQGMIYDQDKIAAERTEIENILKNNGYYDFSRQYINYEIDTSLGDHQIAVRRVINNPANLSKHKIFVIDSVIFVPDVSTTNQTVARETVYYNGITYSFLKNLYSPKILDRRTFIYPGERYNKQKSLETQRQIANLNNFRYVNINYDTTGGKFVANIFASPLKKHQFSSEVGLTVTYGYPGPFINLGYGIKNIFKGLENFDLTFRAALEGVPSATEVSNIYGSREVSLNGAITFPQFLLPGSNAFKSRFGRFNPKTVLSGGFQYINRPEYERNIGNIKMTYTWRNRKRRNFSVYPIDLQVINSRLDSAFEARLDELQAQGNNLKNSFVPAYVGSAGVIALYDFNNYANAGSSGTFVRIGFETGGTFLNLFDGGFFEERNLQTYKYIKGNFDTRQKIILGEKTTLAMRVNIGAAFPYGDDQTLPYEKYFFAGGSVSIRAWRPRRLGPGSYTPTNRDGQITYDLEQPGEILLESSFELRQSFTDLFKGALFVDAGNVWTIRTNDDRYNSGGSPEGFYKEIAIGAGAGVRFDFQFFLFRLDAAYKIYDPARQEGNRFIWDSGYYRDPVVNAQSNEFPLINFAIGYPF